MAKFPVPEILRVPLESISLTVKVMREEEDVKVWSPYLGLRRKLTDRIALFEQGH